MIPKLFWSSRPISWINTAFPFAAGYYLVLGEINLTLVLGFVFFLIPYNLLMYGVNDVFDYESDLRNPRKGGIEGALLEPKYHRPILLIATLVPVPFLWYLFVQGDAQSNLILGIVIFSVLAYSLKHMRFKEIPFLDSITSATHFVGPLVYGISLAGGSLGNQTLILITLAFFLWGMASPPVALGASFPCG